MQNTKPKARDYQMPSITHVLAQAEHSQLRLPSYRFSHGLRYHPYPRFPPHYNIDTYMETAEYHSDNDHFINSTALLSITQPSTVEEEAAANIYAALNPGRDIVSNRIRRLSIVIIDLALAVTKKVRLSTATGDEDVAEI